MRWESVFVFGLALSVAPSFTVADESVSIGPVLLFSEPDLSETAYREAEAISDEFLAALGSGYSRNMLVKADTEAIKEFIHLTKTNSDGLGGSFDVSAFSDVPCVVSSVRSRLPRFTPGSDEIPTGYRIEAGCEGTLRVMVRISVEEDKGTFRVALISQDWGVFVVKSLGDWEYSLAYRNDEASSAFPLSLP